MRALIVASLVPFNPNNRYVHRYTIDLTKKCPCSCKEVKSLCPHLLLAWSSLEERRARAEIQKFLMRNQNVAQKQQFEVKSLTYSLVLILVYCLYCAYFEEGRKLYFYLTKCEKRCFF